MKTDLDRHTNSFLAKMLSANFLTPAEIDLGDLLENKNYWSNYGLHHVFVLSTLSSRSDLHPTELPKVRQEQKNFRRTRSSVFSHQQTSWPVTQRSLNRP